MVQRHFFSSLCTLPLTLALAPSERAVLSIWGFGGRKVLKLENAANRFAELSVKMNAATAAVYARGAESSLQAEGVQSTRSKNTGGAGKPWQYVGRVAASEEAELQRAIHAQRELVVQCARDQHKLLRFVPSLSLAYTTEDALPADELRIGSFRCGSCGTPNGARAASCSNCGQARSPDAPRAGGLTLAVAPKRERPLPLESCGFLVDEAI
mmetsp:Transcript_17205/g.34952  ORF Transcript_17205/g.34952 Transcript_17205/m.34952 type:complete len:211 (+) Transcript_17205:25-657(+)